MSTLSRKVVLHVGLPKTGTSYVQNWFYKNSSELLHHGINYPRQATSPLEHKHQFLVDALLARRYWASSRAKRAWQISRETSSVNQSSTLVLSAEGISRYAQEFTYKNTRRLREVFSDYAFQIFLVKRNRDEWLKSYHQQIVLNPSSRSGQERNTLTQSELAGISRVKAMLDIDALRGILEERFSPCEVFISDYDADWWQLLLDETGVPDKMRHPRGRMNIHRSLDENTIEFIRQINLLHLPRSERSSLLGLLQEVHEFNNNTMKMYSAFTNLEKYRKAHTLALEKLCRENGDHRGLAGGLREHILCN